MHHILEDERTAPTVVGGRYLPQRLLKAAHGLSTWVAADLETGRSVVVKTTPLAAVPEGTELVLRHEAAVLASVECPHLAPLLDVGVDADALYLVTPYVPGVSLDRRLRVGPLDVDDALTLARSVAAALAAVWERGVLHRDIKPSSIVVNEGAPLAAVTLIDFGFSRADAVETSLRGDAPTVARYVSPERAGLVDLDVDQRSDLYSLGAVLFEALAGRPPYSGSSVREILRHHVTAPIPSLRSFGLTVPRAVDEIVQRLLAKDPADRYQTPEALLADLATVSDALRAGHADPAVVIGTHDRRCCVVGQPAFVGRGVELSGLAAALDEAAAGRPALVALEAASGGGKTRLLDEFAQQAAERGAWVVRGRALDQVATLPFQPLQGIAAAFEAERDPDTVGRIAAEFGAHAHAAVAALPSLADVFPVVAEEVLGPEAYGETRTVDALAALLAALGDHERPAVVLLDDLQWTDRLTCAVLARWQRETRETGRGHVLVVAAYRGEDVGLGHPVLDLAPDRRLNLAPLADIDLRRLVESMAGAIDGDARDTVVSLAEGSPFMASAVLHGLVEADALVCRHPGWVLDPDRMDEMQSSRRSAAFLARRLDLLPPATLELLLAAAVLGREFDLDLAAHLAGQPADTAVPALHDARRRHLIWSRSQAGRSTFVHDRIRETLLARLHPDERRSL
ncbi:MAG TPA: AAA family ATPase, partial [Acidimicrobiia bacterium]|nr:AAA family ATPase [Acidimicrobiia bacterium]